MENKATKTAYLPEFNRTFEVPADWDGTKINYYARQKMGKLDPNETVGMQKINTNVLINRTPAISNDYILKDAQLRKEGEDTSFVSTLTKSSVNTASDLTIGNAVGLYNWAEQNASEFALKIAGANEEEAKEVRKEMLEEQKKNKEFAKKFTFDINPYESKNAQGLGSILTSYGLIGASITSKVLKGKTVAEAIKEGFPILPLFGISSGKEMFYDVREQGGSLLEANTKAFLSGTGEVALEKIGLDVVSLGLARKWVEAYVAIPMVESALQEGLQTGKDIVIKGDRDTRSEEEKYKEMLFSTLIGSAGGVISFSTAYLSNRGNIKTVENVLTNAGVDKKTAQQVAFSQLLPKEAGIKQREALREQGVKAGLDPQTSQEIAEAATPSVEKAFNDVIDILNREEIKPVSDEEKENLKKAYEDALQYGGDDAETYIVMKDEVQQQLLDAGYSEEEADMNSNALASLFMNSFEKAKKENPDLDFETAKEKFFDIESIKNYAQEETVAEEDDEKLFSAAAAAMYPNPRSDIDSFYEFVKNNPNHKKSYMVFESKGGLPLDIVSDTIKHGENDHNLSVEEWRDVLDNIDNIEKATFSAKPTSYGNKAYLLKIKTPKRKYGISVAFNKGHNYVTTIFKTTDKGYEHWVNKTNKKTAVAPAPYPQVGSSSTQRGNVSYGLSVEEVINLLKSNVNKNDIRRSSKLLSKTIDTDNVYGATKDDGEPISNPQNFNAFIEGSKVSENDETVSPENPPKKLYRGDTRYFEEYQDQENAFEYNWGKGFYLSDSEEDVITNYQRGGVDLNNRIEREAEQLSQEEDIDYDEAKERIRQQYEEGDIVRTFYVSMKEPVIVGGDKETFFEYNEEYDEETDEYGEPSGKGVELIGAIENYLYDIGADDYVSSIIGELQSRMMDNGGLTASEVEDTVRGVEESNYLLDYDSTAGEMLSSAFASIGFDGIIDHRAGTKFKGMSMPSDTTHYVVFNSEQAKATDNKGEWGVENKNFYYSKKSEEVLGSYDEKTRMVELFKGQNPSTLMHELSHHFLLTHLKFMEELGLIKENAQVYDWLSRQSGRLIEQYSDLTRADKETLTEAFIEYVNRGVAPNIATQNIFQRAKKWVLDAYKIHRGKASKEIREYFDSLISKEGAIPNVEGLKLQTAEIKNILKSVKKGEAVTYRGVSKRDIKDLRKAIHTRVGRKGKSLREELIANGGIKKGTQLAKALSWDSRKEDKLFTDKKTAFDKEDALIDWLMSEGYILPYQDNESYDDTQNRWDEVADLIYNSEYVYKDEEQRLNESRETSLINQAHAQEIVDELLQDNELGLKSVSDLYYLLSSISSKADETDIVKVNKDALKYLDLRLKDLDKDYKQILKIQEKDFKEKAKEQLKNKTKELKEGFKEKTKELQKEAKKELNEAKKEARQQGKDLLKANEEIRKINEENEVANIERELARQTYIDFIRNQSLKGEDKVHFMEKASEIDNFRNFISLVRRVKPQIERVIDKDKRRLQRASINALLRRSKPKKRTKQISTYTYNKLFEELRAINKMTKEAAASMLASVRKNLGEVKKDGEVVEPTYIDIIKNKMLNYKANGMKTSSELMESLYNDLMELYHDALVKGEEARIEKAEKRLSEINKVKDYIESHEPARNFISRIFNKGERSDDIYVKNTNFYGISNALFGKKWADEHEMVTVLNKASIDTFKRREKTYNEGIKIYKAKDEADLSTILANKDDTSMYKIISVDGGIQDLSIMGIMDLYLGMKNTKTRKQLLKNYEVFDEEGNQLTNQIDSLIMNLSQEDREFADYLQKDLESNYSELNKLYIKMYGIDMPREENYFPRKSERNDPVLEGVDLNEFSPVAMVASQMKDRATAVKPVLVNAFDKYNKNISDYYYMIDVFEKFKDIYDIVNSKAVKGAIESKYVKYLKGGGTYGALVDNVASMSLQGREVHLSDIEKTATKSVSNIIASKIAFNPSVFMKQLISITNYAVDMPLDEFSKNLLEGILHPRKTMKFMNDFGGGFFETRMKMGLQSEAVARVVREVENLKPSKYFTPGGKLKWSEWMGLFVKWGDILPIYFGGYAKVKYMLDSGMSIEEAREKFEFSTLTAQQDANAASLAGYQRSKTAGNMLFSSFLNAPAQYMRQIYNADIQYRRGEISAKEFVDTVVNYGVIQPALYILVSNMLRSWWDDDDETRWYQGLASQIITSPFQGIPIVGAVLQNVGLNIEKSISGESSGYDVAGTLFVDDLNRAFRKISKKEKTLIDVADIITPFIEPFVVAPITAAKQITRAITTRID